MSNTTHKLLAADKVREALALHPDSTAAELAEITGLGRSTVNKQLAALKTAGSLAAVVGDGHGRGRTPTRWSLTGQPAERPRLRPGELDAIVLDHVHGLNEPVGPTAVGKALGRSAGAVANCMARLADAGQFKQTSEKPRRYEAA
jgi:predicted ArsR family transcriptional regulator